MCSHVWIEINDVSVCQRCGLTVDKATGKFIMFDRRFANVGKTKRRKKK